MISHRIIHIGIGSTGEGIIRNILGPQGIHQRIRWLDERAHQPLSRARLLSDAPSFTFIRNPYDWYISSYIVQLKYHRWRGSFRDWFFERYPKPMRLAMMWKYFGGPEIDYVGRFEHLLDDLVYIFGEIIPDIVSEKELRETLWPANVYLRANCKWIEGYEQWLREDLITPDIKGVIDESDGDILEQFGYTYDERYYFEGGAEPSCHEDIGEISWEQEKRLSASWVEWGHEQRGVFVRESQG